MPRKAHPLSPESCIAAAVVFSFLLTSCATIFNGTSQKVKFESEPSGAEVMVNGVERGTTPTTITLTKPGLSNQRVTFVKEGYEDKTITLQKKFATASIWNIFGPTLVGFGIDAASGALFNYSPTHYSVELEKEGMSSGLNTPEATKVAKMKWYNLKNLQKDDYGNYIVPEHDHAVSVIDTDSGTVYTFR